LNKFFPPAHVDIGETFSLDRGEQFETGHLTKFFFFESFCSPIFGAFVNRKILLSKAPEVNKNFKKCREMTVSQKSKLSFKL